MTNIPPLMIFSRLLCWLPLLPAPKWSPSEVQPLALSIPCTLFLGDLTQAMTLISCPWVWLPNLLMISAFRVSGWNSGHHELFLSSRTTFLSLGVSSKPNPPTCSFPPAGSLIPHPPCDTVCSYSCEAQLLGPCSIYTYIQAILSSGRCHFFLLFPLPFVTLKTVKACWLALAVLHNILSGHPAFSPPASSISCLAKLPQAQASFTLSGSPVPLNQFWAPQPPHGGLALEDLLNLIFSQFITLLNQEEWFISCSPNIVWRITKASHIGESQKKMLWRCKRGSKD